MPYLLRPFQEDTVQAVTEHIRSGRDLIIDKTREMGVTWLVLAAFAHRWIFDEGFTACLTSITEDKIDRRGDPNCLFWKFDYLIRSLRLLPPLLRPLFYPAGYVDGPPTRTHLTRINPKNRSVVGGEVMGPNLLRSGRVNAALLDEFAEAPEPQESWNSSANACPARVAVWTPRGMNFAGQLANPPADAPDRVDKITLHWMIDPTKNGWVAYDEAGVQIATGNGIVENDKLPATTVRILYPWYERAKVRLNFDPVAIAQELDVNYSESTEGVMYPQIARSGMGRFEFDPSLPLYCSMDYGLTDATALIWWQWDWRMRRFVAIDAFEQSGKTIVWFIPFITGRNLGLGMPQGGYTPAQLEKIESHRPYNGRYVDFFGDPTGVNRNQVTGTSVVSTLIDHGIYVTHSARFRSIQARRDATAPLLPFTDFDEIKCAGLVTALRNSRLGKTGVPVHDEWSHYRTAAEYFYTLQPHGQSGALSTHESDLIRQGVGARSRVLYGDDSEHREADRLIRQAEAADAIIEERYARLAGGHRRARSSSGWGRKR